jgi:PIN domain nuclease of toxin-antitoxin system
MIVLDTHSWIWWVNESATLTSAAEQAIAAAEQLGVHVISCWELGMLVEKGRLGLRMDVGQWVELALQRPRITLLPFSPRAAVLASRLPGAFHGDPADRFIAASCLIHGAPLVSKDKRIRDWGGIEVIW